MAELRNGASPARPRGPLGRLATCVFLALFGAGVAAGQAGAPAEGPLGNDTFVPVDLTADELLRNWAADTTQRIGLPEGRLTEAFRSINTE